MTTLRNVYVEISSDTTAWTDISGQFNKIDISGGEIETGEVYVAASELPIVGIGKKKMTKCKVSVLYTEGAAEPWRRFFNAYKHGEDVYLRYAPKGNQEGNLRFTSGKGYVTSPVYPQGEVGDGKPLTCELEFTCPGFTDAPIPAA